MNVDLKTLSITEKKSLAYDLLALIEQTQRNLQVVNQAIAQDQQIPNAGLRTPDVVPPVEKE